MNITSNGSKSVGEPLDSVEKLLEVLKTETLDPKFEKYGNFVTFQNGQLHVFGNFVTVSHVFNISGTVDEMRPLARAIKEAKRRVDYLRYFHYSYKVK